MPRKLDGIYQDAVEFIHDTWKNNPFRIPILMLVTLITTTASLNLLYNPQAPAPTKVSTAKANTYQFVPTAGNLVTGTELNADSVTATAAEGRNTGSWKGTLADDALHWQVDILASSTPNVNLQLDLGTAKLANANKLLIQTEIDLDKVGHLLKVQICDWVSSTSVDNAADSQCTTGGWRSLNSQTTANADVDIALTTSAAFQWHIFDGYFSSGTGGGTTVSTPLTNFTNSDTQPLRIRYWSDTDTTCTSDCNLAIDFLRANAFVDSVYHPTGAVNTASGGSLTGTYANAHVVGNSATAQQSVTAGNAAYITAVGTGSVGAEFYFQFKNVKPYTGANTFYFKADYSCSAATVNMDHKFSLYNYATTTWTDFNSAVIACATGDSTQGWAIDSITPADYIDESSSDEVRVRFQSDLPQASTTLRVDFAYLMLGSVNADTSLCEITWGSGTATDCSNTRTLNTPAGTSYFNNTAEDRSATADNDYYPTDCVANVTTTEECAAANISFPVTVPTDGQVVVNHFATRHRAQLNSTNPDLLVTNGLRDYSGTPTSTAATGGWTTIGPASTAGTFAYSDSIIALAIGTYGNQTNPDDHVDTVNNRMNMRLRTSTNGNDAVNNIVEWDFAFVSIGWVVDSSHPTRNYQFAPTGHTLATGTQPARNAEVAASAEGVNTGGFKGTLGDDNMHWMVTGANLGGSVANYDAQLNFTTAKQNGANKLIIQAAVDLDAALAMVVQICDWVSTTSVDNAADSNCTGGGWRTLNSQNTSNADVALTTTTNDTSLQWHIFDGYFTTGTTGGSPVSTPLRYFFDATNGIKIRFFSTTQSATDIAIDFVRVQPIIDTLYHPASVTALGSPAATLGGTYANAHVIGNTTTAQQSVTDADDVFFTITNSTVAAEYYFSFKNIKTYSGMNSIYVKMDYSCSSTSPNHTPRIWNFTSGAWENLSGSAITCSTTEVNGGFAKSNINLADYINGGELRVGQVASAASANSLRMDLIYVLIGSTNADTADCAITFGTGTATNCSNTRDLDHTAISPSSFQNPAEDESTTMGTGDSNAFYALDTDSDGTAEEATSANISFPVTQPSNSAVVGEHFAGRFSGCGNTGAACGASTLQVQMGFKDYSGFNQTTGGWLQVGASSATSTLAYTDTVTALTVAVYGQQINPEDYLDTANNEINIRLRTNTGGTAATNVTTVWDFAMVSIQWIEIGNTIDISGSSSVTGQTVALAVDGLLEVGKTGSTSGTCPCSWSITSVFVAGDRPVLVWHDAASDANESSGITVYDGGSNITGMQLTAHTLSVGSVDDQTTDSTDLVKFDNDANEDVMYKFVTTTFTVDATSTYTDDTIDLLSGDTLSIGGSETMVAYNTTINGTLTSGGATAYTIQGDWVNNGTFNESTSTVTMDGTTSQDMNSGCSNFDTCTAQNFYNLTINKTDASSSNDNVTLLTNHLRVSNTLTITDGELIQGTLNVRVEGSSAVSVGAAGTWTNISTGDLKLGGTFVNNGAVTFNSNNGTQCVDAADDIAISSTSGGSVRTWSGSGTETIYNVDVTDMADSSVTAYTSNFTNTTWTVGSCGIAITGSCDQYDQTTDCTDDGSNQFRVAVNGSLQAQVDTTVDGTINITGVTAPSAGDIITVFIDNETTDDEEAVAVTKYDGTGDVTGVILYWRHLTIGSGDNQTLSNADIDAYDNSVTIDEDIFFDVSVGDDLTVDTLTSYSDEELYIVTGNVYRPASGGGGDVNTTHLENDGTITADSNAINVFGNWQNDSTFTAGTSTTTFTSTTTGRTLAGTMTGNSGKFNNLIFNGASGAWSFSAAVEASNDFQVSNGAVTASNNNLTVGRDFTLDNTAGVSYTAGSSTLNITRHFNDAGGTKFVEDTSTVNQTGTGTITVGNGGDFNNLSVGYTSFTTTFSNNNWDVFGTLTFNGGTVSSGGSYINLFRSTSGSSVTFASATTLSGSQTLYHRATAGSFTFTMTGGNYGSWTLVPYAPTGNNSVVYTLGGNVTTTGNIRLEADDTVTGSAFNTSGSNYSLSAAVFNVAPCTPTRTGPWAIDFNDSSISLTSTATSFDLGNNCGSHTLDLDTSDVTVNGSVQFVDGTTTVTVTPGSSDFTFAPTASQTETYAPNSQSLWNMIINGANSAATIQPTAVVDVNNNFTITAGTYDTVSGSNYALTIGNNYSNSGTFTAQQGTVTFDATDTGNTLGGTMTGASAFFHLTFAGSGGEWTPSAAVTATRDLTMTNGSLLGSQNITVNGHVQGTSGTISLTGGTFEQRLLTGGLAKNFGTTSGSTAWTFNDLTFSNGCTICTGGTVTTQTGGSGGINVSGILRIGKSGDGVSGTTTLNAGNRTWTLSGTGGDPFQILASPAGDLSPSTSTFTYTGNNGGGDTTVQSETYNNLIVNNGSETFNLEATTAGSAVTITAGTLAIGANPLSVSGILTVDGTLSGTGDVSVNNNATGTGTINLTGGTFLMDFNGARNFGTTSGSNSWTFNNLTFYENCIGTCTVTTQTGGTGAINVGGILRLQDDAIDGGALNAGNRTWTLSGTGGDPFQITSPCDLVPSTSTFTYTGNNGGGDTTIQSETYNNLITNNGSESYNLEGATTTVDLTVTAGTLAIGSNTTTVTDDLTVDGTFSGTGNVNVSNDTVGTGIINLTGGTFTTSDSTGGSFGTSSGSNNWTFNNILFRENTDIGGMTITTQTGGSGGITVSGILTVGSVGDGTGTTLNAGNRTWTLSGTGGNPFQLVGTAPNLVPATSTFTYTGNNPSSWTMVQAETYHHLTFNNGSELYVLEGNSATDEGGDLTISAGTFDLNSNPYSISVGGSWTNNGNFTSRTGTVFFTSTTTGRTLNGQMTSTNDDFYDLVFNGVGGAWTFNADAEIGSNLTITNGTITAPSSLTITGNYSNAGGFIDNSGTVTFNASDAGNTLSGTMTGASNFNNITFNGTGSAAWSINNALDAVGTFSIADGAVTQGANIDLTLTGDVSLSNGVNFIKASGSGKFIMDGDATTETFTDSTSPLQDMGNVQIGMSPGTTNLSSDFSATSLTILTGDRLNTRGWEVTLTTYFDAQGTAHYDTTDTGAAGREGDGTITTVGTNWTFSGTGTYTLDTDASTPTKNIFNGTADQTITTGGKTFYQLDLNNTGAGGSDDIIISGALDVNGAFTITDGDLDTNTNDINTNVAHDFTIGANGSIDAGTGTWTFDPTGTKTWTDNSSAKWSPGLVTIGSGSSTPQINLGSSVEVSKLTISASHTLALQSSGYTLDVIGDGASATVLTNSGTLSPGTSSTVKYSATNSGGNVNVATTTYNSLNVTPASGSETYDLTGNLTGGNAITGSVTIGASATLDAVSGSNYNMDIQDDWTNSGTFTARNGTVTFSTTATARLTGATTFYNFTSTTAAKTIEFTAGQTFTIASGGLLTLTGTADPNEIQIKSSSASSQWFINHQGTESVSYVQVIDSGCDGSSTDITTSNSVNDGNNGTCWKFNSVFSQEDYRFGQPNGVNIDYTGAPAENAAYSTSGTGDDFRLRMLVHVADTELAISGKNFKLQFGEKTAATCASGVSWGDVATGSGVIRYYDGGGRADGDNLTTNGGDPSAGHTVVAQDYEEANNFTNSVAAIPAGQDGLWDFSLINDSAVGGKRYCFRAVESDGTVFANGYAQYPEVIIDEELIFSLDATSKDFGTIQPGDNPTNQTSTVTVTTNAATGYVVYGWTTQAMTKGAHTIADWSGTNATPTSFPNGSFGFGYSTDDSSLTGGTADRFTNGGAKYAGFVHSGPGDPVADRTSGPVASQSNTITYRLAGSVGQQAGKYETIVVYVASVTF